MSEEEENTGEGGRENKRVNKREQMREVENTGE